MKSVVNRWYCLGIGFALGLSLIIFSSTLYFTLLRLTSVTGQAVLLVTLMFYAIFLTLTFKQLFSIASIQVLDKGVLVLLSKKTTCIPWSSITDIDYYCPNGFLQMTTITIRTVNSLSDVKLYTAHYANRKYLVQAIKYGHNSFKQHGIVRLQDFIRKNIKSLSRNEIKGDTFEFVTHSPFGNPRSYFPLIGLFALYKLVETPSIHILAVLMLVVLIVLSFLIGTIGMGRVGVSDRFIVFSSFYYPYRKYYRICDIDCITFEYPTKNSSKAARVIMVDGGQKLFVLANFTKASWALLGEVLTKKRVTVINR